MKQNTKDWIQYGSAIALIASAIGVGTVCVVVSMDIPAGPLAYIAEALSAALAIFGVAAYALGRIRDFEKTIGALAASPGKPGKPGDPGDPGEPGNPGDAGEAARAPSAA